jgi:hypothetical protein
MSISSSDLRRRARPAYEIAAILVLVVALRFALFGSDAAWSVYAHAASTVTFGWRQRDMTVFEYRRRIHAGPVDCLALGSSQSGAIFNNPVFYRGGKNVSLSIAGLQPHEFPFFLPTIEKVRPRRLVLYLSELNMSRKPEFGALRLLPAQGWELPGVIRSWLPHRHLFDRFWHGTAELALAEVFPEYRYSYVFKGLAANFWTPRRVGAEKRRQAGSRRGDLAFIGRFLHKDVDECLAFNASSLEDVVRSCGSLGIQVVIVEGDTPPKALEEPGIRRLRGVVLDRFEGIARRHSNVRLVRRSELFTFAQEDYHDRFHVRRPVGRRFSHALLKLLDAESPREAEEIWYNPT